MFTRTHISEHLQYCDCELFMPVFILRQHNVYERLYIQIHVNCYINILCLFIVTD